MGEIFQFTGNPNTTKNVGKSEKPVTEIKDFSLQAFFKIIIEARKRKKNLRQYFLEQLEEQQQVVHRRETNNLINLTKAKEEDILKNFPLYWAIAMELTERLPEYKTIGDIINY